MLDEYIYHHHADVDGTVSSRTLSSDHTGNTTVPGPHRDGLLNLNGLLVDPDSDQAAFWEPDILRTMYAREPHVVIILVDASDPVSAVKRDDKSSSRRRGSFVY